MCHAHKNFCRLRALQILMLQKSSAIASSRAHQSCRLKDLLLRLSVEKSVQQCPCMQSHAQNFVLSGGIFCSLCPPASKRNLTCLAHKVEFDHIFVHHLIHIWNEMSWSCIHKLKAQCSLIYINVRFTLILQDWIMINESTFKHWSLFEMTYRSYE